MTLLKDAASRSGDAARKEEFWTDPSRAIPALINITHSGISLGTKGAPNAAVRKWYNQQLKSLNLNVPFTQENATALSAQRNSIKAQARAMMADRKAAALLNKTDPLRPVDYYIEKYSAQGYTGEALWKKIITGSATPNAEVNSKFDIK